MSDAVTEFSLEPNSTITAPKPRIPSRTPETPSPKPTKKPSKRPTLGRWVMIVVGLLVIAGGLIWAKVIPLPESISSKLFSESNNAYKNFLTDTAKVEPFRITVRERGTVDSLKSVTLASKVEGTTTIISIVPEGTLVKEGDLLIELDASALVENEKQQVIALTQAQASLKKAEEGLEIQSRQNESDMAAAELAKILADLDLKKYVKGEYPQLENEQLGLVRVAEEDLERAKAVYEYSQRLAQKGYASANQLEADRIAMMKAEVSLAAADEKLGVLRDYEKERKIEELTALAEEADRALDRVERQGIAALAQFEADLEAAKLTRSVEQEKLDRVRTQIANSKIYAPQAGEVVYSTEDSRRGDSSEVIAEGATVRERKELINLPDLSQMKVDARIHESLISRVREGLPVKIRVSSKPGVVYSGKVLSVSSVPVDGDWMRPDLREYSCVIGITYEPGEEMDLKPGLTAEVEIIVQERSDVLQVPFQSVVTAGGERFAFVLGAKGVERRKLVIGTTNDTHVEILDGVQEGEKVVLNPRTHFSEELAKLDASTTKPGKPGAEAGALGADGFEADAGTDAGTDAVQSGETSDSDTNTASAPEKSGRPEGPQGESPQGDAARGGEHKNEGGGGENRPGGGGPRQPSAGTAS